MQEKSLQTTTKQRVIIIIITILLLISTLGVYMLIVLNGGGSGGSDSLDALTERYNEKYEEFLSANTEVSDKYFGEFSKYRADVKAYNEASATNAVLDKKDLKKGDGRELGENDTDYAAYYIGWCADGEVFDSSFDTSSQDTEVDSDEAQKVDIADAKSLLPPLFGASMADGLIDGWNQGVVGMKLGGVRQVTMNGDLAYGDTREICGGKNKPLRFIIMLVEPDQKLETLQNELNDIQMDLYEAYMKNTSSSTAGAIDATGASAGE